RRKAHLTLAHSELVHVCLLLEHELPLWLALEAYPVVIYSFLAMAQFLQLQTTCGEPRSEP
ncbi:MAG: hypothetical protein KJO80_01395, partial [Gammaproteobacteria bacterium]|nr:hypothetical protein [Gammaproteobacteria bacterium]